MTEQIKFKGRVTLDVYYGCGGDDFEPTDFFPNEVHEVTLLENGDDRTRDVEFFDGTIAISVPMKLFYIMH